MTSYSYRETQVLTATPQQLRLMLIEAALHSAHEAQAAWESNKLEPAFEAIVHCRDVVFELLNSIDKDTSALNRKIRGIYAFLYQTLTLANIHRDSQRLQSAIHVLEEERQTWREVCAAMPEPPTGWKRPRTANSFADNNSPAVPSPHIDPYSLTMSPSTTSDRSSGFSLDA